MARRKIVLANDEIYHLFNRGIASQPIFKNKREYGRALDVFSFYKFHKPSLRYSYYNRLDEIEKKKYSDILRSVSLPQVDIYAFCLMPNHYHFLVKQLIENGILFFISNFQNSYAKYLNKKTNRTGSLFQSKFKAVRIETDEQFKHVARYIHLNPYSSFLIKRIEDIKTYPWSSFNVYSSKQISLINSKLLLSYYESIKDLEKFTLNQADYQRKLYQIKHLTFEH